MPDRPPPSPPAGRRALLVLLAAVSLVAAFYMAATPPFEGPDSGAHYRYARHLHAHPGRPPIDAATAAVSHELILQPPLYYALAAVAMLPFPADPAAPLDPANPHYPGFSHRATISPPGVPPSAYGPARVAALVSLLGGLLAVVATWGWVRTVLPGRPELALAVAAVVGLNPQFVFSSASVTNDAWAAGTFALAMWAAAVAARHDDRRRWALAGAAAGLAAMTKYTGLAVLAPIGLTWLWSARRTGRRGALASAAWLALGFAPVTAWWYGGNVLQYGTLVPAEHAARLMPDSARVPPASWTRVLREAAWFTRSYTGVFGYGVVAPPAYFRVVDVLLALGVAGLCVLPFRRRRPEGAAWTAGVAAAWFAVIFFGLLSFMRTVRTGNQGRLLFPAAPAVAALLVLGWWALAPARLRPWLMRAVPVLMLGLAVWQGATLVRAYAVPPALPAAASPDRPVDARFDGGPYVAGADLPAGGAVAGGGALPVTLYLGATEAVTRPSLLFLHLADAADRRLAGFDGVPAGGRHPTLQWTPGAAFADPYRLDVATVATDTLAVLTVGFYDPESGVRRAVAGPSGAPAGDRAVLGHVMIHARPPEPAAAAPSQPPPAVWANGIVLAASDVTTDAGGRPRRVAVTWTARRPIHADLTVFVQLLDAEGRLVAQVDRRPRDGRHPTDTWVTGTEVSEIYDLEGDGAWHRLIIGFYDASGRRVPLEGGADHAVLASD